MRTLPTSNAVLGLSNVRRGLEDSDWTMEAPHRKRDPDACQRDGTEQREPTVFVVDEDMATVNAIRALSAMMNLRCDAFDSGQEFWDHLDRDQCGCLVTELKVRGSSGLQLQQMLQGEGSSLPVIFLTAHASVSIAVRAMRAGAYHFLEKPIHEQELWDAIQGAIAVDRDHREAARQEAAVKECLGSLTFKEELVLRMIAEGKPNRTIAKELDLSLRTIEIRRNVLMKKLGVKLPEELLRFAVVACNGHSAQKHATHPVAHSPSPPWPHAKQGNGSQGRNHLPGASRGM